MRHIVKFYFVVIKLRHVIDFFPSASFEFYSHGIFTVVVCRKGEKNENNGKCE